MTDRRRTTLLALCLPLALAAGCSNDPAPTAAPPPLTSAPVTPVEVTTSAAPQPWEVRSKDGASAFAHHWIDVLNQVATSGTTAELQALSAPQCQTCQQLVTYIDGVLSAGGSIEGGAWRVLDESEVAAAEPISEPVLSMNVRQEDQTISRPRGPTVVPANTFTLSIRLRWQRGKWLMSTADMLS